MGNTYSRKITPERADFYLNLSKVHLCNLLIKSIKLRINDKITNKQKNSEKDECRLLSYFCVDLHKEIDDCSCNKNNLYSIKLKRWRTKKLNNLVDSYKLQFNKLNYEFLNETEEKILDNILLYDK